MKQFLFQENYPLFTLEVEKRETSFTSVDQIVEFLKARIDENNMARFIAVFDHFSHTAALEFGQIGEGILAAKNIIFCFGITLPNPQAMALRPRSIGVVELAQTFVLTFMEAPMPLANVAMESWARMVRDKVNLGEMPAQLAHTH
ncbi:MAG: hypothetical protein KDI27_13390 [Gammaproteobacteria bacterium]|nr:hypothetical protein [Gammaproteobacteria bacterium]MCB1849391.1 hypothetical protein [Gammaproteobacteria bacterium]